MQTVVRKVCDPVTKQVYEIQLPADAEIKRAVPQIDFPPEGFGYREVATKLAEKFQLSDEQVNAKYKSQVETNSTETVWRDVLVFGIIRELTKEGKLAQPRGSRTPYVLAENIPLTSLKPDLNPDLGTVPEELVKENYQQIRKELAAELLQKVNENTPDFFEKLVVDLLLKMGYGGSWEDAGEVTGGPGDGGIDGIINQDKLGLDVVGIQAKLRTTGSNVSPSVINEFVGALRLKGLAKGVIITTAGFSSNARASAEGSDNPKIVLIDGHQLAQLMIDHDVGVSVEKTYEIKRVDSDYFTENAKNS